MRKTPLFQTVDNRPIDVNSFGPIFCDTDDAWLGSGYYFWDNSLTSAKWWGEIHYDNDYIICRSFYDYHSEEYLDLVGNLDHIRYIKSCADAVKRRRPSHDIRLGEIIELLKQTDSKFDYLSIRAFPTPLNPNNKGFVYFDRGRNFYFDTNEKIQMCVIDKTFLLDEEYTIIYPEIHNPQCAV